MDGKNKLVTIIIGIIAVIVIFVLFKFVIFNDFSAQDDYKATGSDKNQKPALTLKADKESQAKMEEKKEEEKKDKEKEKDKKKDKDKDSKDKKEKEEKNNEKKLKEDAKNNALKALEIQSKPKDEFEKEATQSLFNKVATSEYVDKHQDNKNQDDKNIKYKNVSLDIDNKELKKDEAKGTLKFDKLTNPKSKKSDVKPSTEVNNKISVVFKKEDGTYKVNNTKM